MGHEHGREPPRWSPAVTCRDAGRGDFWHMLVPARRREEWVREWLAELHYARVIAMEFYPTGDVVETLRRAREEASAAWGK